MLPHKGGPLTSVRPPQAALQKVIYKTISPFGRILLSERQASDCLLGTHAEGEKFTRMPCLLGKPEPYNRTAILSEAPEERRTVNTS